MKRYDPKTLEPHWQQVWADTKLYAAKDGDTSRKPYYFLMEFPYPSGDGLHVGHVLGFTALDIMARHKRMQGFNVLYPIGFDAFGLPTENYAIKHKIAPQLATERNVANFRRQFQSLGLSFDWDREVNTTDPSYYRWTQWIFLQLLKKGLAYQDEIAINWCPFEKTGLANEEVVDGKHERCGTPVEKKLLKQWLLRITWARSIISTAFRASRSIGLAARPASILPTMSPTPPNSQSPRPSPSSLPVPTPTLALVLLCWHRSIPSLRLLPPAKSHPRTVRPRPAQWPSM
jgi:leucyl-tRNA synthetase